MQAERHILITGGAGFIGSHVVRRMVTRYPNYRITNLDKLTYAGNLENLRDIETLPNYQFIRGDIADPVFVMELFRTHRFDGVIHLAAESHVDRSIIAPDDFVYTNIIGTVNLLNAARAFWNKDQGCRFHHISTDEVFGSLGEAGYFTEQTPYDPRSPYAASKASSDFFVRAYGHTYGLPYVLTNCSNNYGPYQFPEKLIPLVINNIRHGRPIPVYAQGQNVRDWLYVEDHAAAIDLVFHRAVNGATYTIGGNNEWRNIDVVRKLCALMDQKLGRRGESAERLITFVADRPGHDYRYAINSSKIRQELGWAPVVDFDEGLRRTVDWYLDHTEWLDHVTSGAYRTYYERMYAGR
ncbi:MAG: dTDP-glucose 4,6-dehydratase [Chitinophagales bacterium]|nr:dTDP-glucose 4,6-dehydratase [Chitinophagales bacterium]MDW8393583.1 dTDP-glucose 4,6-dehydratase [Chitinophagales bacterium]